MSRRLVAVIAVAGSLALFAYLCFPGNILGTFFYNIAPPLFRQTVKWEQSSNILQQQNGQVLWSEVQNHIWVSLISAGIVIATCLPLGIAAARQRQVRLIATNVVGIARAIPGVAVLFLVYPWLHQGELPGIVSLTLLGAPPVFLNTVAGYAGVDRAVVESARGMGMNRLQILLRIESPLAAAVVIAGIRIAMVEIIASATILAYSANFPTLGAQISYGLDDLQNQYHGHAELFAGIAIVAGMALGAELILSVVQWAVAPVRK